MKKGHSKLLHDLIDSNPDIESIFLRLEIIMSELPTTDKTKRIRQWIHNEVTGYTDKSSIPEYRSMQASAVGSYYFNSRGLNTDTIVPLDYSLMPSEERDSWETMKIDNPITVIQDMITSNKPITRIIPKETLNQYSSLDLLQPNSVGIKMVDVKMKILANQLSKIETTIKIKLISIIIELEKEFSKIDSLDIPSEITEDTEKIKSVTTNIVNIIKGDSVEIGDNNEIQKSKIGKK